MVFVLQLMSHNKNVLDFVTQAHTTLKEQQKKLHYNLMIKGCKYHCMLNPSYELPCLVFEEIKYELTS